MNEDLQDAVSKAMLRAWKLGQTYCQQEDSESYSQNKKADETQKKFDALVDEIREAIANTPNVEFSGAPQLHRGASAGTKGYASGGGEE